MKRQIINEGVLTKALTDEKGTIYGITLNGENSFATIGKHQYYWSDVLVYSGIQIVRLGQHLVNPTEEQINNYVLQSKINLNFRKNLVLDKRFNRLYETDNSEEVEREFAQKMGFEIEYFEGV